MHWALSTMDPWDLETNCHWRISAGSYRTSVVLLSQTKMRQSPPGDDVQTIKSALGTAANSTIQGPADSSAPKSNYTYTRLGLWEPSNPGSTPSRENSSYVAQSITTPAPSASPIPAPDSDPEQKAADDHKVPRLATGPASNQCYQPLRP